LLPLSMGLTFWCDAEVRVKLTLLLLPCLIVSCCVCETGLRTVASMMSRCQYIVFCLFAQEVRLTRNGIPLILWGLFGGAFFGIFQDLV